MNDLYIATVTYHSGGRDHSAPLPKESAKAWAYQTMANCMGERFEIVPLKTILDHVKG